MIMWIAGAPHNGSTLIRQIIKQCFGFNTYSKYIEENLDFLFPGASEFARVYLENEFTRLRWLWGTPLTTIIKTHEMPIDTGPAIFVMRDGRDAVTALSHFWKIPISYVITGQLSAFPGWSDYFWAWNPLERPNTILVKFEDMIRDPNQVAREQLGPFFGLEPKGEFVDKFEKNKNEFPQLFQDSGSCWQHHMTATDLKLFWRCHGEVMKIMGYGEEDVTE